MVNEQRVLKIKNPPWWQRRTRTEKSLIAVLGVLIVLIIIVLSVNLSRRVCKYGKYDICQTPECIKVSYQVLEKVDLTMNPCDDFYKFACGNFIKNTILTEEKTSITSFTITDDVVTKQMESLLKQPITDSDIKPFVLAKSLYQACMNTKEIETNSVINLKKLIRKVGGWPVIEGVKWNESNFDWISTSYNLMTLGFDPGMLINLYISYDFTNSTKYSLFLDQVNFPLDKIMRKGFNDTIFQAYYDYMVKIAVALGAEETRAKQEMRDVADLIVTIAKITLPDEKRRNKTLENNPMTIQQLQEKFTYVPWLQYINKMLNPYKIMTEDDIIIVKNPEFNAKLENILNVTSEKTLANYMYWMTVKDYVKFLNDEFRDLEQELRMIIYGGTKRFPRWMVCTQTVMTFYIASGALYVRNFFQKESKNQYVEMVGYIKAQFMQTLKTTEWMDETTKQNALNKLKVMHLHEPYPKELEDDEKLEEYYEPLVFNSSDYLGCALNWSLFNNYILYPQLDHPLDKKDWRNHGYVVLPRAFYDRSENSIEFLAAILQNVFFDANRPQYMNYGAIGHVIGHEITHGFDDVGRQYDQNGNLVEWWNPKTKAAFDDKAQCIIDQYSNITVTEVNLPLNGLNTQGENIADNGGIKLAYLAYKEWSKSHKTEPALTGLSYTPEQMFWISVANIWCSVETNQRLENNIRQEPHSPSRYRVNVALMNSEFFAKDFNCPTNSNMNPKHKCVVW